MVNVEQEAIGVMEQVTIVHVEKEAISVIEQVTINDVEHKARSHGSCHHG